MGIGDIEGYHIMGLGLFGQDYILTFRLVVKKGVNTKK